MAREHRHAGDADVMRSRTLLSCLIHRMRDGRALSSRGEDSFRRGMIQGAVLMAVATGATRDYLRLVDIWRRK